MKYPEISKRITYILNLRGLKAQDLADKTGINKASISQYVNGSHCPSNEKATLMGDVLRVNPIWLMGFDVPMDVIWVNPSEANTGDEYKDEQTKRLIHLFNMLSGGSKDNAIRYLEFLKTQEDSQ